MNNVTFFVPAITCGHCVNSIEVELGEVAGVINVKADLESKEVIIEFEEPASINGLKDLLAEINYPVQAQ